MAKLAKFLQGVAGAGAAGGLNVEEVFSTYLYDGTGSAQTITNGIDLAGEGGAILTKRRDSSTGGGPWFNDTERGITKYISTSDTGTGGDSSSSISAVTSSGYTLGGSFSGWNNSAGNYASWTFRKAPKFFDVVTYTGNGTAGRTVSHNLGTTVGSIFIKRTDTSSNWRVFHRSESTKFLTLNSTAAATTFDAQYFFGNNSTTVTPSDTTFTLGTGNDVNASGGTYVAYLFAHNDGDGEFGPDADQDVIKAGSFTKTDTGGTNFIEVNLGFEVQWLLVKATSESGNWEIWDVQRGLSYNGAQLLNANSSSAESSYPTVIRPTPNGFEYNDNNAVSYIYIAIRRGPMAVPESATDVFDINTYSGDGSDPRVLTSNITPDLLISATRNNAGNTNFVFDRLRADYHLITSGTNAEDQRTDWQLDYNDAYQIGFPRNDTGENYVDWMWKRAPNYFDVVAYTGNSTAGRTVSHNLGVAPEMMWVKKRSSADNWRVYHPDIGINYRLGLDSSAAASYDPAIWNGTSPTDTNFTVGSDSSVNGSGSTFIAYLFASLDGVSKVGSYTGDGTTDGSNVVDCGFSNGARFILVKSSNSATNWGVFDTARGITSGNDPRLRLNTTDAEFTTADFLVPTNSGFAFKAGFNTSGNTYIFYAVSA